LENLLIVIAVLLLLFIITHLRPLNAREVKIFANKRRDKMIYQYFNFNQHEYSVDKTFKKNMNPNGMFYEIDENLYSFPSIAAGLLKYKKHEWIIIAFEKIER
jgi:hypothetical protein